MMSASKNAGVFVLLLLAGCSGHNVYLTDRNTGATAQNKFRLLSPPEHVIFDFGNRAFTGRWVYMQGGGSVGFGTATAFSGGHSATATGMSVGLPTGGNGSFIGSAPDGTTLRCTYAFSEWNLKGLGLCEDNKGGVYDLQIS